MRTYAVVLASVITAVAILFGVFITRVASYSSPERYFQKGKRNYEVQNYEDAINNFNEYLSIKSRRKTEENIAEANFLVADSLKNLKKYSLAKQRLSDIINDPKYISYYTNALLAYADIARLENASDAYLMVKLQNNLNTSDKAVASTINMQYGYQLLFLKRYGEALSYFLRADGELALLGRARAYFEMGEFDRAFEIYKDFLVYYKNSAYYSEVMRTYLIQVPARAHRYFIDKNYSKARLYYTNIASLFPTTEHGEEALFRIAQSYYIEKNYNKAVEYYTKVRQNNVSLLDAEALLYIGLSYFKVNRYSDSYKVLDQFISDYPSNANVPRAKEYLASLENTLLMINNVN